MSHCCRSRRGQWIPCPRRTRGRPCALETQCDSSLPGSQSSHSIVGGSRAKHCEVLGVCNLAGWESENLKGVESFHCCGNTFFLMLPLFLHVLYVLYAGQTTQMSPRASSTFTLASDIEPTPERPVRCICRANMEVLYMWAHFGHLFPNIKNYIDHISKVGMFGQTRNFSIGADSVCLEFKAFAIYFLLSPLLPDLDISWSWDDPPMISSGMDQVTYEIHI